MNQPLKKNIKYETYVRIRVKKRLTSNVIVTNVHTEEINKLQLLNVELLNFGCNPYGPLLQKIVPSVFIKNLKKTDSEETVSVGRRVERYIG